MKTHLEKALVLCRALAFGLLLGAAGCQNAAPPVEPITIEMAVGEITRVFTKSSGKTKAIANEAAKAITANDFALASKALTALTAIPELEEEQRSVASRCLISVNEKLQEAAVQGNPEAMQQIQIHQLTK